jgi:nucleotide-binding universal stress UspA family protein
MFGTIVLGVDGAEHAQRATQVVSDIATASGDKVVVVHLLPSAFVGRAGAVPQETPQEARDVLRRHLDTLEKAGVAASGEVRHSMNHNMAARLLDAVAQHEAGLLVVGSRGRSELLSDCPVPLLIVRDLTAN